MNSQGWKPIVYLGTTAAGVLFVMGLAYVAVLVIHPGFSLSRLERNEVKIVFAVAAVLAYGTGMGITRLLKKRWGHKFGTYLDDPDAPEEPLPPPTTKVCLHCRGTFPAYRNDLHAAGFCSPGCREHYPGK